MAGNSRLAATIFHTSSFYITSFRNVPAMFFSPFVFECLNAAGRKRSRFGYEIFEEMIITLIAVGSRGHFWFFWSLYIGKSRTIEIATTTSFANSGMKKVSLAPKLLHTTHRKTSASFAFANIQRLAHKPVYWSNHFFPVEHQQAEDIKLHCMRGVMQVHIAQWFIGQPVF